jgi:tetratricopeptide (TPR) repeat protein
MKKSKFSKIVVLGLVIIFGAVIYKYYAEFNSSFYLDKGRKELQNRQYSEAIESLKRALPSAKKWEEVELVLIQAYRRSQTSQEAVEFFRKRMQEQPDPKLFDRIRCYHIGDIYHKELKDLDQAVKEYNTCIEKYEDPASLNNLAEIYEQRGEIDSAIIYRVRALQKMSVADSYVGAKNRIKRLSELVNLYAKAGRDKEAVEIKKEIAELESKLQGLGESAVNELIESSRDHQN